MDIFTSLVRHVYENGYLCVSVDGALRSMEFPSMVAKCHYLRLIADRTLAILPELLKGVCNHFWIWDNANNPHKQLPGLRQILDFLFKPRDFDICCKYGLAFLEIQIRHAMKYQLYEEIIGRIRERFLSAHDPSSFVFGVEHEDDLEWPNRQPFILEHPHSNKKLRLQMLAGNSFRISNSESDNIIVF
ncbi:hypothetical protein Ddc_13619 [Ditylenchus destructor]|nr:hypothetical protein Ddc_13619 [Ditylenchus destructor]